MKNINLKLLFVAFCSLVSISHCYGQLRLPNIFSDHMVLQREVDAKIWGWAKAGSHIKIHGSWMQDTIGITTDYNGKWSGKIKTIGAGGPYAISIQSGDEKLTISNVLLGDVFLCSGQSNMEWGGDQGLKEIMDELPNAYNSNIRLLQVNRNGASTPQENISNNWSTLTPESLKPFSAIGYFLAKEINFEIGVPIGIINASWGGTSAEVWTPEQVIQVDKELYELSKQQIENPYRPHNNGVLWNSMISPLVGFPLKALFWYQGESNVSTWWGYDKLMKAMVGSWRSAWEEKMPFYFVQIAPFEYNNNIPKAALLREQQNKTALELPNSGMVVTTDLVDNIKDIHPSQKKEVAVRLSKIALAELYGKPMVDYKSPIYNGYKVVGNKMEISFHHLNGNLVIKGKQLDDIYICSEDRVFHKAKSKVIKNKLIVYSEDISNPVAVRFGFTEISMPNLFNENGLPIAPFRTDNWEVQ